MNLLAEDLMLLLLDERTGHSMADSTRTPRVLAGAVLLDLIEAGAIRLAGPGDEAKPGRIVVSANRSADPILGDALARIEAGRPMQARAAIEKLSKGLQPKVLHRLADEGLVRVEHHRALGVFPRTAWVPSEHRKVLRDRLTPPFAHPDAPVEPRAAALISLLSAADAAPKVFPDRDRRMVKQRAKEIAAGDWAAKAARDAVRAVDAALTAAVVSSAAATGSA
ncbi:GPP34 family phosphoprotein [Nocardia beijingensis]|uniref:GOLPH3/VPS74 family protein n=1 Tax=Nocardia beijingensis TaxID=95162 RepID=UPI00340D81FF